VVWNGMICLLLVGVLVWRDASASQCLK